MRNHYDVPLPKLADLLTPGRNDTARVHAAESFIQLCALSEILGDILPIAYDLRAAEKDLQRELRRIECDLDNWEANLPPHLQATLPNDDQPGTSNLRFCFYSIRLLLNRVALRVSRYNSSKPFEVRTDILNRPLRMPKRPM